MNVEEGLLRQIGTPVRSDQGEEWGEWSSSSEGAEHSPPFARTPNHCTRNMGGSPPIEPTKCLFLLVFLTTAALSNWAVLAYITDFVPRTALPDITFKYIEQQAWAAVVGDAIVTLSTVLLAVLLVFHEARIVIARRVVFIAATLYAMRFFTLFVTQLPSGYADNASRCQPSNPFDWSIFFNRFFVQTMKIGFQDNSQVICGDMMFSGHSLVMLLCALTITYYLPDKHKLLCVLPWLMAYFGMACMVISRTHYTIDVLIAYWLTNFVFVSYHSYCESDVYMDRKDSLLFHFFWLSRVVAWLEENIVPGKVENRFENPFKIIVNCVRLKFQHPGHHKHISISSSTSFGLP